MLYSTDCISKLWYVFHYRLHEYGLLLVYRMVEASVGQGASGDGGVKKRMGLE
jgi:hypothetical protein